MMVGQVEVTYDSLPRIKQLLAEDPANYEALKRVFGSRTPALDANEYEWRKEIMLDQSEMKMLSDLGIRFEVHKVSGTLPVQAILPQTHPNIPPEVTTVYVQVPHIGLLHVNEVRLEENCCTDRLQTLLDEGWRLLCVCPPNAQRRPDYILGRTTGVE
jgi:hypothetical protein